MKQHSGIRVKNYIKACLSVPKGDSSSAGNSIALHDENGSVSHAMGAKPVKSDIVQTDIAAGPDPAGLSRDSRFAESFRAVRGTVDAELDPGF